MKGERIFQQAKYIFAEIYGEPELHGDDRKNAYEKCLKLIRKAAYLGHPEAQWNLALHYEDFNCIELYNPEYNPNKCVYWYTKACDGGSHDACNSLAINYNNGEGCKQDIKKALELYIKAIELGNPLAKKNYKLTIKQIEAGKYQLDNQSLEEILLKYNNLPKRRRKSK